MSSLLARGASMIAVRRRRLVRAVIEALHPFEPGSARRQGEPARRVPSPAPVAPPDPDLEVGRPRCVWCGDPMPTVDQDAACVVCRAVGVA